MSMSMSGPRSTESSSAHGRLKARLRPMSRLKRLRSVQTISARHAFVQNIRRGHCELATETAGHLRLAPRSASSPGRRRHGADCRGVARPGAGRVSPIRNSASSTAPSSRCPLPRHSLRWPRPSAITYPADPGGARRARPERSSLSTACPGAGLPGCGCLRAAQHRRPASVLTYPRRHERTTWILASGARAFRLIAVDEWPAVSRSQPTCAGVEVIAS
jgi:hypothetical protein